MAKSETGFIPYCKQEDHDVSRLPTWVMQCDCHSNNNNYFLLPINMAWRSYNEHFDKIILKMVRFFRKRRILKFSIYMYSHIRQNGPPPGNFVFQLINMAWRNLMEGRTFLQNNLEIGNMVLEKKIFHFTIGFTIVIFIRQNSLTH